MQLADLCSLSWRRSNVHTLTAPISGYFRKRRMAQFEELFRPTSSTRIIDVGGTEFNWSFISAAPQVTLLNITGPERVDGRFEHVHGDGRRLQYATKSFDIAYSNSVIEHVGTWEDQVAFASELRRVGRQYYVQTPNRWFFVEPHLWTPAIHYLPTDVICRLARNFTLWGWIMRPSQEYVDEFVRVIRLLDRKEVATLFPDAIILEEKVLGLTKSFIACRK